MCVFVSESNGIFFKLRGKDTLKNMTQKLGFYKNERKNEFLFDKERKCVYVCTQDIAKEWLKCK